MEETKPLTYYHFGEGVDGNTAGKMLCKNTYRLQLTSLLLFASAAGYAYNDFSDTDGDNFIYVGEWKTSYSIVKFNTMVGWYNNNFMDKLFHHTHGKGVSLLERAKELHIPLEGMQNAIEGKLIKRVYLQSNKNKDVIVQRHIIEFAE